MKVTKYYYCANCGKKSIQVNSRMDSKLGVISKFFNCFKCNHRPNPNGISNITKDTFKSNYEQGQIDLINDIKSKVDKLVEVTSVEDLPFDLINLLRNIETIRKQHESKSKRV